MRINRTQLTFIERPTLATQPKLLSYMSVLNTYSTTRQLEMERRLSLIISVKWQKTILEKNIEFLRVVAEGDLVALHTHQQWPGNEEYVTMDFFRFDEHGKIVEHWDAVQEVPDETKNGNSMV